MNEDIEELLPLYALGALDDEERAQVERYLAAHPEVQSQLDGLAEAASLLAYEAEPIQPAPEVKQALMARISADQRSRAVTARPRQTPAAEEPKGFWQPWLLGWRLLMPAFAGASLVLAFVAGAWALAMRQQLADQTARLDALSTQVAALESAATALEAENAVLLEQLQSNQNLLASLAAPGADTIAVPGTEAQPGARGRLIVGEDQRALFFVASGLQPLPGDQVYQLWLIHGDQPQDAGIFSVDAPGQGVLAIEPALNMAGYEAIGVSVEPQGGSEQPTGEVVMLGTR